MQLLSRQKTHSVTCPASVFRLDSGLTLVHQQTRVTPVAVADVWVRAGARYEPSDWTGMAHFLEHMIFKGTRSLAPGAFDARIEQCGGMANAATSYDYAHFFLTAATEHLPQTLPHLAEILLRAEIPEGEFDRERDVVIEELYGCLDEPDWLGFQSLCQNLYGRHPYGRSILGTEALLREFAPAQMRTFHRARYQPENMTVALVGDLDAEAARELVEASFANFEPRATVETPEIPLEPPLTGIRREEMQIPHLEQARVMLGWIGPGVDRYDDAIALEVLSALLTEGRAARWTRALREETQLVLDIASLFSLQREASAFTVTAVVLPDRVALVEEVLREGLRELAETPVEPAELQRAQRLLVHDYAFSTETPGQLAGLYGYYSAIADAELATSYPQRVQAVTAEHLQHVARRYLACDRYAVTVLRP